MARKGFQQLSNVILVDILSVVHSLVDINKFQQYSIHDVIHVYFKVSYPTCCGQPPSSGILQLLLDVGPLW
jgi:hypothetical protein